MAESLASLDQVPVVFLSRVRQSGALSLLGGGIVNGQVSMDGSIIHLRYALLRAYRARFYAILCEIHDRAYAEGHAIPSPIGDGFPDFDVFTVGGVHA